MRWLLKGEHASGLLKQRQPVPNGISNNGLSDFLEPSQSALWPQLRRLYRLSRVMIHIVDGLCMGLLLRAYWQPNAPRVRLAVQRWQRRLLDILHVHVTVFGEPDETARFLVSNHISWLDIPVIGAVHNVHFLSKAEVRDWPLIGALANAAGTLYIRRGGGESRRKAGELAAHLSQDRNVLVFPEGTTTNGRSLRRFFPALFRAPLLSGVAIQPVTIRYLLGSGEVDEASAFIGDDTFQGHLWRLLRRDNVRVELHWLPRLAPSICDADYSNAGHKSGAVAGVETDLKADLKTDALQRSLCQAAQQSIAAALNHCHHQ